MRMVRPHYARVNCSVWRAVLDSNKHTSVMVRGSLLSVLSVREYFLVKGWIGMVSRCRDYVVVIMWS